jgi:hypothetical protein
MRARNEVFCRVSVFCRNKVCGKKQGETGIAFMAKSPDKSAN